MCTTAMGLWGYLGGLGGWTDKGRTLRSGPSPGLGKFGQSDRRILSRPVTGEVESWARCTFICSFVSVLSASKIEIIASKLEGVEKITMNEAEMKGEPRVCLYNEVIYYCIISSHPEAINLSAELYLTFQLEIHNLI